MTTPDTTTLGPVLVRLRGTLAPGGYLTYLAGFVLVAGVVGLGTGQVLDGLYGLVAGSLLASPVLLRWRQEVTVHQDGFVWRRLTGTRTVRRAEIRSVRRIRYSSFLRGNFDLVLVTRTSGKQLSLGWIEDAPQLARLLAGPEPAPMPDWQPPVPADRGDR